MEYVIIRILFFVHLLMLKTIDDSFQENDDPGQPEWEELPETQIVEIPQVPAKPELPPSMIRDLIDNGDLSDILRLPEIKQRSNNGNALN